jgi:hypothetical protein
MYNVYVLWNWELFSISFPYIHLKISWLRVSKMKTLFFFHGLWTHTLYNILYNTLLFLNTPNIFMVSWVFYYVSRVGSLRIVDRFDLFFFFHYDSFWLFLPLLFIYFTLHSTVVELSIFLCLERSWKGDQRFIFHAIMHKTIKLSTDHKISPPRRCLSLSLTHFLYIFTHNFFLEYTNYWIVKFLWGQKKNK